jgi:hypothetical protein
MTDIGQFFSDVEARVGEDSRREFVPGDYTAPFIEQGEAIDPLGHTRVDDRKELMPVSVGGLHLPSDEGFPWREVSDERLAEFTDAEFGELGADTIACYLPWHVYHDAWGIVINQEALECFTTLVAREANVEPSKISPLVLGQILEHEYTHFTFELAGTTIEDIVGEPRYLRYVMERYGKPNRWTSGPLEELVATSAEATYAALPMSELPARRPRGFARAVKTVNRQAPPGYCDFERMEDPSDAERIVADVGSLVAGQELWNPRWYPGASRDEKDQVQIYVQGDENCFPAFGFEKGGRRPTVSKFEDWAEKVAGATLLQGTKHRKVSFPGGRTVSYSKGKKKSDLLRPHESPKIASAAGLEKTQQLYRCIFEWCTPAELAR